jgi:hypothetical protein
MTSTAAPTTPPAASPAAPPPPPAEATAPAKKPASLQEAREQLLQKRRESARKPVPDAAPKAKADAKAGDKSKAKGKSVESDSDKKAEPMSPRDVRAAEEANMAFSTGLRELKERRYREALDSFSNAERLDRKRTLGVSVVIAQMRAYAGLKRLPDVARLSARLLSADVKSPEVVDAMMLGVDAAEKTGDTFLAEQLWTRLLEVPDKKALAQRGLERTRKTLRAPAPASVDMADDADRPAESEAQK